MFRLYQSCRNKGSVGRVSVFGLRWCGWLGPGRVGCCYVCLCCESGFFVEITGPGICVLFSADSCAS